MENKVKTKNHYIIYITISIILCIILCIYASKNYPIENNETEQMPQIEISDTILIANDSVMDTLKANYGLQVINYGFEKTYQPYSGGYKMRFYLKFKNISSKTIGDIEDVRYVLKYKVIDPKTNEAVISSSSSLYFSKVLPNEIVRLEPDVDWTRKLGKTYKLHLWIEDIPLRPFNVTLNY